VQGFILVAVIPGDTYRRFMYDLCWILGKEVVYLEEPWCKEGGTLPWVVQVEGNERLLVGIVVGVVNL
jgi:hypothetical protein